MTVLSYVFLGLFPVAAVLNLIAVRRKMTVLFAATKPLLLLLLCLYCLFRGMPAPDLLLFFALAACWLGDVLLLPSGNLWFVLGGVSFFAGHILLIFNFVRSVDFVRLPIALPIVVSLLYAMITGLVMFRVRKKAPPIMQVLILLYLLANTVMNLFALSLLFTSGNVPSCLSSAGAVLFFTSDCALFLLRYDTGGESFYRSDFFVMLTYISGVLLITLGLAPVV